jgi:hypothetical protein
VLEQHHARGWQIIDYNATTLPQPLGLADELSDDRSAVHVSDTESP